MTTTTSATTATTAATATTADAAVIPARPVAAQAHALRAAAALIERAGIAGLSLTIDNEITIQVPVHLAGPAARTAAVAGRRHRSNRGPRHQAWQPDLRVGPRRRAARRARRAHLHSDRADAMTNTMNTHMAVTDRNGLAGVLRQLKLSGMLETLDARLAQASAGDLGHLEFLQVLCEDEISRRDSVSLTKRIRRARFETQDTLEGFDFAASPKLPAAQIRDLAALRWLHAGQSVILYGPVGVGKTHLAQALGHLAVRHRAEVRFLKTSRALAHLAGGHADHTWDKRLRELTRPHLLILDDFGLRELTATQADDLYELVTERADRSLILTSNRSPADWYPLFPNPVVAESLLDRLINTSHQVFMNGPSYRPNKRPGRVDTTGKEHIR